MVCKFFFISSAPLNGNIQKYTKSFIVLVVINAKNISFDNSINLPLNKIVITVTAIIKKTSFERGYPPKT